MTLLTGEGRNNFIVEFNEEQADRPFDEADFTYKDTPPENDAGNPAAAADDFFPGFDLSPN
jgi:hypothetical protein